MRSLRLQGFEASARDFASVGLSYFLPGGGAEMDTRTTGKIYVVLDGQITIDLAKGSTHLMEKLDSCFIGAGETRAIYNKGNAVATKLVVMPAPNPAT